MPPASARWEMRAGEPAAPRLRLLQVSWVQKTAIPSMPRSSRPLFRPTYWSRGCACGKDGRERNEARALWLEEAVAFVRLLWLRLAGGAWSTAFFGAGDGHAPAEPQWARLAPAACGSRLATPWGPWSPPHPLCSAQIAPGGGPPDGMWALRRLFFSAQTLETMDCKGSTDWGKRPGKRAAWGNHDFCRR